MLDLLHAPKRKSSSVAVSSYLLRLGGKRSAQRSYLLPETKGPESVIAMTAFTPLSLLLLTSDSDPLVFLFFARLVACSTVALEPPFDDIPRINCTIATD